MRSALEMVELDGTARPEDVAAAWPRDRPLVMLRSARFHPRWARWSICANPTVWYRFDGRRGGESRWIGEIRDLPEAAASINFTHDPLRDLDAILHATRVNPYCAETSLPFHGGWIGYFGYELGRIIEPAAQHRPPGAAPRQRGDDWPPIELAWCPDALVHDALTGRWYQIGGPPIARTLSALQDTHVSQAKIQNPKSKIASSPESATFLLGALAPTLTADAYMAKVARTLEYIAAGDIFQANIAQHFEASFDGSIRALAERAFAMSQPWYGAYLELPPVEPESVLQASLPAPRAVTNERGRHGGLPHNHRGRALLSLSPELFLQLDPVSRQILTRPIKGTRPASSPSSELRDSAKDAAELHMIVDLMRNDLGRVCAHGSVRVPVARAIETHPTVHHGVAEIIGQLRAGATIGDVLRATFPGGSITGAPKIRAMQIIDELEASAPSRGPYSGAIGFISNCGRLALNIAIRTLMIDENMSAAGGWDEIKHGRVRYWAGAGIVADSDRLAEYQETLDKTAALHRLYERSPTARLARSEGRSDANLAATSPGESCLER